jgi:transcriptional regulator with XRE-family HTH domain
MSEVAMESETVVLQRKIIGVLMRAARERAHHTVNEVAQRLGVTPARIRQYERGTREVSLPEIEILAQYLQTPYSFFFDKQTPVQAEPPQPPTESEMRTRRALIGTKLKQARLAEAKSKEECAQALGRKPATIGRYERGLTDIPLSELDQLAHFLRVNLYYFIEKRQADATGMLDLDKLARMPKEVRAFVTDPANLTFIRMAMKFADLPTNRLKELGEILLVVR